MSNVGILKLMYNKMNIHVTLALSYQGGLREHCGQPGRPRAGLLRAAHAAAATAAAVQIGQGLRVGHPQRISRLHLDRLLVDRL